MQFWSQMKAPTILFTTASWIFHFSGSPEQFVMKNRKKRHLFLIFKNFFGLISDQEEKPL